MTSDDARQVTAIIATAHGGCSSCVAELVEDAEAQWPEVPWRALCCEAMTSAPGGWLEGTSFEELHAQAAAFT